MKNVGIWAWAALACLTLAGCGTSNSGKAESLGRRCGCCDAATPSSGPAATRPGEPAVTLEQAEAIYEAGLALQRRGDVAGAVEKYRLAILTDFVPAINHLAWLECTYPIEKYLNPPQALELSLRAYKLAVHPDKATKLGADVTDTVAAAYARMGRYDKAVEFTDKALAMAQELKLGYAVKDFTAHRELYLQHKPFSDVEQLKNHRPQE
jgi:tetratricopeptide (TPR) repeat protein